MTATWRVLMYWAAIASVNSFAAPATVHVAEEYGRIPIWFEKNLGQAGRDALFVSRGAGYQFELTRCGATLRFARRDGNARVSVEFAGASRGAQTEPEQPLEGRSNYYFGNDRTRWVENVPHYSRVRYRGLYPGVDAVWYQSGRQLEYDLVLKPGADPSRIRLRFRGAESIALDSSGDITLKASGSELRQVKPSVWQQRGNERVRVDAEYVRLAENELGVRLARYDRSLPLTIDPVLAWSTFLSGSGTTQPSAIAVDSAGDSYITGSTVVSDFPGTPKGSGGAMFVTKLNAAGTGIAYATYFGMYGNGDQANAVAIDGSGNAYVAGQTVGTSLPVTAGTLKSSKAAGTINGFVLKFDGSGEIVWGTYLGGSNNDAANAIAVDEKGNTYIAGYARSTDFPTSSGSCASDQDAFVATLNASGTALLSSVCFGGGSADTAVAIALDPQLNVYVVGNTQSANLPTTPGAIQSSLKGTQDAFVAMLTAGSISWLTYLGGSGVNTATSIAVDAAGNTYLAGTCNSIDFPVTAGAFDTIKPGGGSYENYVGFIAKVNSSGTTILWATYLGGSYDDRVVGVAVDASGNTYVSGRTGSTDFPTTPGALFSALGGIDVASDAFVAQLSPDGSTVEYSGRSGGTSYNGATAMARDNSGAIYVTGWASYIIGGPGTVDNDYPTTPGVYEPTAVSGYDQSPGFVTKVDLASPTTCNLSLSASGAEIPGYGGSGSFTVTIPTGCPWEAVGDNYDLMIDPKSRGTSSSTVSFSLPVNNGTASGRTMHIRIGPETYTITQDAGSCADPGLNPASLHLSSAGGFQNVNVTLPAICSHVPVVSDGWMKVDSYSLAGFTLFVAPDSFAQRTGSVSIGAHVIPVTQDGSGCTANVTGPAVSLPAAGGTGSIQVGTSAPSCYWGVYGVPSWMQVNAATLGGQGNASLSFVLAPNITAVSRAASLEIAGKVVMVSQGAGPSGNRPASYTASIFAGNSGDNQCCGQPVGDGWPALSVFLTTPAGLAWQNGNLYIADHTNGRVRVVTPDGIINTFAGGGSALGGPATSVDLGSPQDIAVTADEEMYVLDYSGGRVWRIAGGSASLFAGAGTNLADNLLYNPLGLAVDPSKNVYIADTGNNIIRDVSGGEISTVAGTGSCAFSGDNGPAIAAGLCSPWGLAFTNSSLFLADGSNQRVRTFSPGGAITTFAGGGSSITPGLNVYVPATSVSFWPYRLAADQVGNLYIADARTPAVWRAIQFDNGLLPTPQIAMIAGSSNNGTGLTTASGVAADTTGNVYVSDDKHIWKLTPTYSFCSINGAPSGAPALTPTNGTTGVVVDPILTWTAVAGATSYDVYVGTANPPPFGTNVSCTGYSAQRLSANTTYYWQVVPKGASGLTASAVQSFTTAQGNLAILTLTTLGNGTLTANPSSSDGTYALGTKVCLTATPGTGSTFGSWSGPPLDSSNCLIMNANDYVTAQFLFPIDTSALSFVPVTPCRIADTRNAAGPFGGPSIAGLSSRDFLIPNSSCNIPSTAAAYSLNATVVPHGFLGYVTVWPSGSYRPVASTLNSLDGRIKANAAIVPAGAIGAVSVYATDDTDLVLDIDGYFVPAGTASSLAFYPLTPCRIADTRAAAGPGLSAGQSRTFAIAGSCALPSTAQAYSLNLTAVPKSTLAYLTVWPTGQQKPVVSTLNALTGAITANAAIVPAGTSGDLNAYVTDATDLIIDVNGYFAPTGTGGLSFYNLAPCRVLDTRNPSGSPPITAKLDVNVTTGACSAPSTAQAYTFNATVVPPAPLGYISLWPQGQSQPVVSTLNAFDGAITSNMAIVPTTNGSISAFPSSATHLILDIGGYFAP